MFQWIGENAGTIVLSAALAALVVWIVIRLYQNKKKGKSSCGCGCGSCSADCPCRRQP